MSVFDNLTEEESWYLVGICSKLEHNHEPDVGDWYYYFGRFVIVATVVKDRYWDNKAIWVPNSDQWKWLDGWDKDCGSAVDEELVEGEWIKKHFILNMMKPCDLIVAEHKNPVYAHALAWEKMQEDWYGKS